VLDDLFLGRRFDRETIVLRVRWYLRFMRIPLHWSTSLSDCHNLRLSQSRRPDVGPTDDFAVAGTIWLLCAGSDPDRVGQSIEMRTRRERRSSSYRTRFTFAPV
jgi:hypothetical protein